MIQFVHPDASIRMDDLASLQYNPDMSNIAFPAIKKSQVAFLTLLREINRAPLKDLLLWAPHELYPGRLVCHLGQTCPVNAKWRTSAPQIRRMQVLFGNLGNPYAAVAIRSGMDRRAGKLKIFAAQITAQAIESG